MSDKHITYNGILDDLDAIDLRAFQTITPQPSPTSERVKRLLSKGLNAPDKMTPDELQELCASVVYHLLSKRFG